VAFPEDQTAAGTKGRRIYGLMWGIVLNNNDPEVRGRVRTNVPRLLINIISSSENTCFAPITAPLRSLV